MHLSFNWRAMAAATLSLTLATALTTQASALTDQEAATVVTLIERLQPELGPIAYDEEEAEIWSPAMRCANA